MGDIPARKNRDHEKTWNTTVIPDERVNLGQASGSEILEMESSQMEKDIGNKVSSYKSVRRSEPFKINKRMKLTKTIKKKLPTALDDASSDGSDDSGSPVLRSQRSQKKVSLSLPTITSSSESFKSLKKFFQNLPKKKIRKKKRSVKVLFSSSSDEDLNFTPFVARKNRHQVGGHMTMACLTGKGHGKNKAAPKA